LCDRTGRQIRTDPWSDANVSTPVLSYLSERLADTKIGELAKQIKTNGGKHSAKVTDGLTHLVIDTARMLAREPKSETLHWDIPLVSSIQITKVANACFVGLIVIQAVQFPLIKIVDFHWLVDSVSRQQRQSEAAHEIKVPTGDSTDTRMTVSPIVIEDPPSAAPAATVVNEESAASPAATVKAPTVPKGRKRPRNATVPIYVDLSADDSVGDAKQSPPKKRKDGQKAKSTSLRVPVDEHCPLVGMAQNRSTSRVVMLTYDRYTSSVH